MKLFMIKGGRKILVNCLHSICFASWDTMCCFDSGKKNHTNVLSLLNTHTDSKQQ